jgi:hypothetical protein
MHDGNRRAILDDERRYTQNLANSSRLSGVKVPYNYNYNAR